jgi:hypothetical protein
MSHSFRIPNTLDTRMVRAFMVGSKLFYPSNTSGLYSRAYILTTTQVAHGRMRCRQVRRYYGPKSGFLIDMNAE